VSEELNISGVDGVTNAYHIKVRRYSGTRETIYQGTFSTDIGDFDFIMNCYGYGIMHDRFDFSPPSPPRYIQIILIGELQKIGEDL